MIYEGRITRRVVVAKGEALFHESATTIEIDNEAAGEFVVVSQDAPEHGWQGKIAITAEEWPLIRRTINRMIKDCRDD
jgi:hypothetical protein